MARPRRGEEPQVQQIAERLGSWLDQQGMLPGARVPAQRQLAFELGCSRASVRRALALLEQRGRLASDGDGHRTTGDVNTDGDVVAMISGNDCHIALDATERTPFTAQFASIREHLSTLGLVGVPLSAGHVRELRTAFNALPRPPVGWLVLDDVTDRDVLDALRARPGAAPMVIDGANLTPTQEAMVDADRVLSDQAHGAELLVRHLVDLRCTHVVLAWLPPTSSKARCRWFRDRIDGFVRACRALRIDGTVAPMALTTWELNDPLHREVLRRAWIGLLHEQRRPGGRLGVCCVTDGDLLPAVDAARHLGLRPGEDLLFTGYDSYWHRDWFRRICGDTAIVPAASIEQRLDLVGKTMIDQLRERIAGRRGRGRETLVAPQLNTATCTW